MALLIHPPVTLTINGVSLNKVSNQRILGIIIDKDLSFNPFVKIITNKYKIHSKLEYGSIIWGHTIPTTKHARLLEAAQKGALTLILTAVKSTPLEEMEAELCIAPIDLRLQELQRTKAIKFSPKNEKYISNNMEKIIIGYKSTPLSHLSHQVKQLLITISKNLKTDTHLINIPTETPPSFDIFHIPNMTYTLPDKFTSEEAEKMNIQNTLDPLTDHAMVIFIDGSSQGNCGPVGNGTTIRCHGEGQNEAIKLGTNFSVKNIGSARNLFMYSDSQSAIQSVMGQNTESYHNITIWGIRSYLLELSSCVNEMKMIYH